MIFELINGVFMEIQMLHSNENMKTCFINLFQSVLVYKIILHCELTCVFAETKV